jgi:erythromycin esterase-like protein
MWRNRDAVDFLTWLRSHNGTLEAASRVGFYGLDLMHAPSSGRTTHISATHGQHRWATRRAESRPAGSALATARLERAIGVIYRPDSERLSHGSRARLTDRFDAVIHIDETHALEPLEPWSRDEADVPETFPSAL